jgi:hypothetical protein
LLEHEQEPVFNLSKLEAQGSHLYNVIWGLEDKIREGEVRELYQTKVVYWRAPWYQEYGSC